MRPVRSLGLACLLLTAGHPAFASTIAGDSISAYLSAEPGAPNYRFLGTATVPSSISTANNGFLLNFSSTSITVQALSPIIFISVDPFNGFVFDLNGTATFPAAILDPSTIAGLTAADLTQSGNVLSVNFEGLQLQSGDAFTVDFAPAATPVVTPEPSSLLLLGTGALGFVQLVRRRFGY